MIFFDGAVQILLKDKFGVVIIVDYSRASSVVNSVKYFFQFLSH